MPGPRPYAVAHNEQYRKLVPGTMLRHKVKPGSLDTFGLDCGRRRIRVNDQFRVCFVWRDGAAWDVEIVDYH